MRLCQRSLRRIIALAASVLAILASPGPLPAAAAPTPARSSPPVAAAVPARPAYQLYTGELSGALFTIARPTNWNRSVLLLAHGLRDADRPLSADLAVDQLAYKTLLAEGWLIATTSFRRNGLIVADAIGDLDALRTYIEQAFGAPERVVVEGESMGGYIAALLAERDTPLDPAGRPRYTGVIAIGAALDIREPTSALGLTLQPRIPLLFLSNQSEIAGPRAYVEAPLPRPESDLRPVLLRVSRDGHVNVNQRERLAAFRALAIWLDRGRSSLPTPSAPEPYLDVTAAPTPQPSQVILAADARSFTSRPLEISAVYGNVDLNAQPADFAAIGIAPGDFFEFVTAAPAGTFRVRYGADFSDVPRGDWVAFPNADGFITLARNYADAAATARLTPASSLTFRRPVAGP